jgi:hypothetical protein
MIREDDRNRPAQSRKIKYDKRLTKGLQNDTDIHQPGLVELAPCDELAPESIRAHRSLGGDGRARFRRFALRSATGWSQRDRLYHNHFENRP